MRAPPGAPSRRFPDGAGPRFSVAVHLASGSGERPLFGDQSPVEPRASLNGQPSAKLLAGNPSVPGRSPGVARVRGLRRPPPAGTASGSIIATSREDALDEPDGRTISIGFKSGQAGIFFHLS